MARIALVEDDELIASGLARALRSKGFDVVTATTLATARDLADFDLLLCDLGLPDGDGLDLVEDIARDRPDVPIIVLTARGESDDVLVGLSSGAVDYVVKPFRLAELLARVDAQLRLHDASVRHDRLPPAAVVVGDLELDVAGRRVLVAGREVDLRRKEFDLLARLAESPGAVVARAQLIADVWGDDWWGSTKTLDVHVNSIRRKFGEVPGRSSRIAVVRRVGYRLDVT